MWSTWLSTVRWEIRQLLGHLPVRESAPDEVGHLVLAAGQRDLLLRRLLDRSLLQRNGEHLVVGQRRAAPERRTEGGVAAVDTGLFLAAPPVRRQVRHGVRVHAQVPPQCVGGTEQRRGALPAPLDGRHPGQHLEDARRGRAVTEVRHHHQRPPFEVGGRVRVATQQGQHPERGQRVGPDVDLTGRSGEVDTGVQRGTGAVEVARQTPAQSQEEQRQGLQRPVAGRACGGHGLLQRR